MPPSAQPTGLAAAAEALRVAEKLEDGELILLAVKPSRWFVLLVSWPAILLAALVPAGAYLLVGMLGSEVPGRLVGLICTAVACTRVTFACLQWQGRLYILTNRRVIRVKGAFREDLAQCRLKDLAGLHLCSPLPDRLLGVASLLFERTDGKPSGDVHWIILAEPKDVQRAVHEAWTRAR